MKPSVSTILHDAVRSGSVEVVETLLAMGFNINGVDVESENRTALHIAAKDHNLDLVKLLLSRGADPNQRDKTGMTPMSYVIAVGAAKSAKPSLCAGTMNYRGDSTTHELIKELLAGGADPNTKNFIGRSQLIVAVMVGDLRVVKRLIEAGADVNSRDNDGKAALHVAALNNDIKMVKYLLTQGAKLSIKCRDNETALHVALKAGRPEVADFLIEAGINVDCRENDRGLTALHIVALTTNDVSLVKKLISRNADLDLKNDEGMTALSIALVQGALEVADLLIKAGGDVNNRAIDGSTVLHLVVNESKRNHITDGVQLAKQLLKRGVDVNIRNSQGQTALHLALINEELEMAKCLINAGVDVNCREEEDFTALHLAAFIGDIPLLRLLLSRGADMNVQNYEGDTALHIATTHKKREVVEELLSREESKCVENKHGNSALNIAFADSECSPIMDHFAITEENTNFQDATFTRRHMSASRKSPNFQYLKSIGDDEEAKDLKSENLMHHIAAYNMNFLNKKIAKKALKKRGKPRCKCEPQDRLMLFYFEKLPDDSMFPLFCKN